MAMLILNVLFFVFGINSIIFLMLWIFEREEHKNTKYHAELELKEALGTRLLNPAYFGNPYVMEKNYKILEQQLVSCMKENQKLRELLQK